MPRFPPELRDLALVGSDQALRFIPRSMVLHQPEELLPIAKGGRDYRPGSPVHVLSKSCSLSCSAAGEGHGGERRNAKAGGREGARRAPAGGGGRPQPPLWQRGAELEGRGGTPVCLMGGTPRCNRLPNGSSNSMTVVRGAPFS